MKQSLQRAYLLLVYSLLYIPLFVLILYSVNQARYSLQWQGFSLQWYIELFHDDDLWVAFFHSAFLATVASVIATLISLFACIHLFLNRRKKQNTLFIFLVVLIIIPDLVLGVALLLFLNFTAIPFGFFSLLIAHITFCIPFVVITIHNQIQTLDANIYFSALDLGASRFLAFRKVMIPLLWPSILSSFLLSFTLSFDDVIISYFVAGPDYSILPLTIYSLVRVGVTPELNALCSITFLISMIIVICAHYLNRRNT